MLDWYQVQRSEKSTERWQNGFIIITLLFGATIFGIAQARAQWVEAPGRGWIQLSVYHHETRQQYGSNGALQPLFSEAGRSLTTSVFVTGTVGLVRGVDLWVQVPYHRLVFNDAVQNRSNTGISDPKLHLRVGAPIVGINIPVSIRAGVKIPSSDFEQGVTIIPVGEGQRDFELIGEAGFALRSIPIYSFLWVGYRWRERNEGTGFEPGDELFMLLGLGETAGRFTWKFVAEGIYGYTPVQHHASEEQALVDERREILQFFPSMGIKLGPGTGELGLRLPLAGRNMPSGPALTAGYFLRWR